MAAQTPSQEIFLQQWQTYRKITGANYMFHVEVYDHLQRLLMREAVQPFRLMDIACGDASWTRLALKGTNIAHYYGVDISESALDLAAEELKALNCPVVLQRSDFVDAVRAWSEPVDVVWIGQSLHHLRSGEKLPFMRRLRAALGKGGLLVIWEPTTNEGEDRAGWLKRFEKLRPQWSGLTLDEWSAMVEHIRSADFPETAATWHALGRDAGFAGCRDILTVPNELAQVYCYRV